MSRPTTCGCDACRRPAPDVARWPFVTVLLLVALVLAFGCAPRRRPCEDRVVVVVDTSMGVAGALLSSCPAPARIDWSEWQDGAVVASCVCP